MVTAGTLTADALQTLLNVMPLPILVVDDDLRVLDHNEAARGLLSGPLEIVRGQRGGRVLNCLNAASCTAQCGHTPACPKCGLRNALNSAVRAERLVRARATLRVLRRGVMMDRHFQVTVTPFPAEGESRWLVILEDRDDLVELERLLPICPSCREPRSDEAVRALAEAYLRKHWDGDFTACMCEDCLARLYIQSGPAKG